MVPLSSAPLGTPMIVTDLQTSNDAGLRKLTALGIMPGVEVILEQRFPSYILQVGRTRAALDRQVVQSIWVKPSAVG